MFSLLICSGGFHQLWWINSKPTIYNFLHGFQQKKRLHDRDVPTITLVARLTI